MITANWAEMTLDYVPHKGTEMMVIRPSEEVCSDSTYYLPPTLFSSDTPLHPSPLACNYPQVIEGLDADSLELQTIFAMGKPMEFFKTEVGVFYSLSTHS